MISDRPSEVVGPIPIPALGGFLCCCPYALMQRADVQEAWSAHRWWEKGQLGLAYGDELSVALRNAISAFDQGLSHGERARLEESKKNAK